MEKLGIAIRPGPVLPGGVGRGGGADVAASGPATSDPATIDGPAAEPGSSSRGSRISGPPPADPGKKAPQAAPPAAPQGQATPQAGAPGTKTGLLVPTPATAVPVTRLPRPQPPTPAPGTPAPGTAPGTIGTGLPEATPLLSSPPSLPSVPQQSPLIIPPLPQDSDPITLLAWISSALDDIEFRSDSSFAAGGGGLDATDVAGYKKALDYVAKMAEVALRQVEQFKKQHPGALAPADQWIVGFQTDLQTVLDDRLPQLEKKLASRHDELVAPIAEKHLADVQGRIDSLENALPSLKDALAQGGAASGGEIEDWPSQVESLNEDVDFFLGLLQRPGTEVPEKWQLLESEFVGQQNWLAEFVSELFQPPQEEADAASSSSTTFPAPTARDQTTPCVPALRPGSGQTAAGGRSHSPQTQATGISAQPALSSPAPQGSASSSTPSDPRQIAFSLQAIDATLGGLAAQLAADDVGGAVNCDEIADLLGTLESDIVSLSENLSTIEQQCRQNTSGASAAGNAVQQLRNLWRASFQRRIEIEHSFAEKHPRILQIVADRRRQHTERQVHELWQSWFDGAEESIKAERAKARAKSCSAEEMDELERKIAGFKDGIVNNAAGRQPEVDRFLRHFDEYFKNISDADEVSDQKDKMRVLQNAWLDIDTRLHAIIVSAISEHDTPAAPFPGDVALSGGDTPAARVPGADLPAGEGGHSRAAPSPLTPSTSAAAVAQLLDELKVIRSSVDVSDAAALSEEERTKLLGVMQDHMREQGIDEQTISANAAAGDLTWVALETQLDAIMASVTSSSEPSARQPPSDAGESSRAPGNDAVILGSLTPLAAVPAEGETSSTSGQRQHQLGAGFQEPQGDVGASEVRLPEDGDSDIAKKFTQFMMICTALDDLQGAGFTQLATELEQYSTQPEKQKQVYEWINLLFFGLDALRNVDLDDDDDVQYQSIMEAIPHMLTFLVVNLLQPLGINTVEGPEFVQKKTHRTIHNLESAVPQVEDLSDLDEHEEECNGLDDAAAADGSGFVKHHQAIISVLVDNIDLHGSFLRAPLAAISNLVSIVREDLCMIEGKSIYLSAPRLSCVRLKVFISCPGRTLSFISHQGSHRRQTYPIEQRRAGRVSSGRNHTVARFTGIRQCSVICPGRSKGGRK